MGLLVECLECKKRNSQKAKNCKCGFALAKFSGRVWWIEYYDHDKRLRRERIGPNKAAAVPFKLRIPVAVGVLPETHG